MLMIHPYAHPQHMKMVKYTLHVFDIDMGVI